MKDNLKNILRAAIAILLIIAAINSCRDTKVIYVPEYITIPEVKDSLDIEPKEVTPIINDSIIYKDKIIKIENPINKELAEKYKQAQDSLEQFKLYLDAITVRSYEDTVEDDNLVFNYKAKTTGTLDEFKFNYTIKEKQIEIPTKIIDNRKIKFLMGAKVNLPNVNTNINFEGLGGIKLKNDNIILGSYNITNEQFGAGYIFSF